MRRLLCLLLALCLSGACARAEGWRDAYARALAGPEAVADAYSVYDVDGDGTPELLTLRFEIASDQRLRVYRMERGEAALAGEIEAPYLKAVCGMRGSGRLLLSFMNQYDEWARVYRLDGSGALREEEGAGYESTCMVESGSFEFIPLPEYMPGDAAGLAWTENPRDDTAALLEFARQYYDSASFARGTAEVHAEKGYVRLYAAADESAPMLRHAFNGEYLCAGRTEGWYLIVCGEDMGYVRGGERDVSFTPGGGVNGKIASVGVVSGVREGMLNVREAPDRNAAVLLRVPEDAALVCAGMDADAGWYRALLPDGRYGYVTPDPVIARLSNAYEEGKSDDGQSAGN